MSAVALFSQHHHVIHPRQLIMSFPTSSVTAINLMFCKSEADFATQLCEFLYLSLQPLGFIHRVYTSYVALIVQHTYSTPYAITSYMPQVVLQLISLVFCDCIIVWWGFEEHIKMLRSQRPSATKPDKVTLKQNLLFFVNKGPFSLLFSITLGTCASYNTLNSDNVLNNESRLY